MTVIEVTLDEKYNVKLFRNKIKEDLENEKITWQEYREKLKLIIGDKPEPLAMEHFHLPLGLWFVGILISLFCFVAEIINRRRKSKVPDKAREVPAGGSTQH